MSRLTLFSVRNRALVALATVFSILAGLWSAGSLPRELFPSLQFPVLVVATSTPGSSTSVIEEQVTEPVETAAQGLNDVVEVTSTSTDGFSTVIVELDYGTEIGAAQTDLQRAVLSLPDLPDSATPQIFAGNIDDFPIIQLAASGGDDARDLVDRLERVVIPDIEDIDGVRSVTLSGVADRVVSVDLDEEAAQEQGVTLSTVTQVLQANGVVLPGGSVLDGETELPVQVGSRLTSAEQIGLLPMLGQEAAAAQQAAAQTQQQADEAQQAADDAAEAAAASPQDPELAAQAAASAAAAEQAAAAAEQAGEVEIPRLRDVATVTLEEREATAYTRTNGEPSVGLAITKTPDGNAVEISHELEALQDEISTALGGGELVTIYDGAPFIEDSIEDLATEGLLGLGFAILVVLVFLLSVRLTLVTAVSIPLSLLIALVGLQAAGYTLNILTLGALTISVGRVVDDSIVVIENIKRHIGRGDDRRTAVVEATREVAGAITSATVATVAVFLPLGFVGGQVGELFRPFAVTVALAMLASLLVALTIIPVLGFWFLGRRTGGGKHEPEAPQTEEEDSPDRLQRAYLPVLRAALGRPWLTVLVAVALLGGTGYAATLLKTDFIGSTGENTLQATLTMPTGTTLEDTDAQAAQVEEWLAEQDEVVTSQVTAGSPGGIEAVFLGSGANSATFAVTLEEGAEGEAFGDELTTAVELPEGATFTAQVGQQGGPSAAGLEVQVQGQDVEDLRETADEVTALMSDAGALDVSNNLTETVPALQVRVDRAAAAEAGIAEAQLGQVIQAATDGATVGQVEIDASQVDVVVSDGQVDDLDTLRELEVGSGADGGAVRLGDVAELETVEEAVSITRIDGLRAATVSGRSTADDLGALTADLQQRIDDLETPEGVQVSLGGVSADQEEAFAALGLALVAAIAIVYLVMVATFNSLVQPLILLVSVPFAATGSIGLLLLTDTPLDIASMVGLLMLIGIVVTNAIVLIDLVNQYRARGLERTDAVVEGARHRFRPIVMTAAATILALTPMAFAITGGGAFISQPLAIVVIGGLISSTALTLILVPVLYELVGRGAARVARVGRREDEKSGPERRDEAAEQPA
ncbi:efflux RND transporter permease subunit [Serinicoccus marinus]|uniref:efflux RND transporter permease subunit n=1 Tax=Serinicoccus marinus TaxID=247333 RepID=UPI0003B7597B|nr:efflux RND transporter permease subunit [Serinicoccus marinus]